MYANLPIISIYRWMQSLSKASEEVFAMREAQSSASKDVTQILTALNNLNFSFQDLGSLYHGIDSEMREVRRNLLDHERQAVLDWICRSGDTSTLHNRAGEKRHPDSGLWFLESADFAGWMASPGFFWLHGIPGCGKTVLCSTIIKAIQDIRLETTTIKLAYFYFNFQDTDKQDVAVVLRSLIKQLCAGELKFPQEVTDLYDRYKPVNQEPGVEDLISTILATIDHLKKKEVYVVMDTLDEFPEKAGDKRMQSLLDLIKQMIEHGAKNLHILATSRNEHDIRATLEDLAMEDPFKKLPSRLKDSIEERLAEGAQGMFRWVVCQLDILETCRTAKAIREALADLPKTLDATYTRILKDISEEDIDQTLSILQWLGFSEGLLTIQELAEAAIVRPGAGAIDPDVKFLDSSDVLQICRSLVSVMKEIITIRDLEADHEMVRFAHFSVQEYLTSNRSGSFSISAMSAYTYIGESCLSYL
ncbi:hypothetical protein N431DRAFT_143912 [Stipitochalara longipes BDJ]|nr:hypothetical protein N431DRAFT_143912 [Stipitochalara longipes BDJ]